jgi:tetratricopeptide (TPR) repeat protein
MFPIRKYINFYLSVLSMALLVLAGCGQSGNKASTVGEPVKDLQLKALNEQIDKEQGNAELYFNRADYFAGKEQYKEAIVDLEKAISIDSSIGYLYVTLSDIYLLATDSRNNLPDSRKAIKVLEGFLEKYPDNSLVINELAETYTYVGMYNESIKLLQKDIEQKQYNPEAWFKIGFNYKYKSDTLKAILSFQKSVEQDPDNYDAYMQLGLLYSTKNDPLALTYFDNALEIDPGNAKAQYAKAFYLQKAGKWEDAKKLYKNIIVNEPQNTKSIYNLGYVYMMQDSFQKAYNSFNLSVETDPGFANGYFGRGSISELMGNLQAAKADYINALNINPDHSLALEAMEELLAKGY